VDPYTLMQLCYVVHGRPGIESKLAIALANMRGPFTGPIRHRIEGTGDARRCTAYAYLPDQEAPLTAVVSMEMAKAEGWVDKKGSKWKTMPDLMLAYRSAMFLIRQYCPEVILGMQSSEELQDVYGTPRGGRSRVRVIEMDDARLLEGESEDPPAETEPDPTEQVDPSLNKMQYTGYKRKIREATDYETLKHLYREFTDPEKGKHLRTEDVESLRDFCAERKEQL
jgi:hypothetical protein